jgi:peptidyl-prolyl cis-trans isomerase B (cyclophilin B)
VASSKDRQRRLAQAKAQRQMARRTERARRRRRIQAGVTAVLTVAAVALIGEWAGGVFDSEPEPVAQCAWTPVEGSTNPDLRDVGTPPKSGIPTSGTKTMTITLGQGVVEAQLDLAKAPCAAESFTYLAGKKFFDSAKCDRLVTGAYFALGCGDPSGTGKGGPTYTFADENLPAAPVPSSSAPSGSASASAPASAEPSASTPQVNTYVKGTLAMVNGGQIDSNGSRFLIFYQDSPSVPDKLSIIGTVTKGLDVLATIGTAGVADKDGAPQTDGTPRNDVTIQSLTVSGTQPATPTSPQPGASTSATPSGTAPSQNGSVSTSGSAKS